MKKRIHKNDIRKQQQLQKRLISHRALAQNISFGKNGSDQGKYQPSSYCSLSYSRAKEHYDNQKLYLEAIYLCHPQFDTLSKCLQPFHKESDRDKSKLLFL